MTEVHMWLTANHMEHQSQSNFIASGINRTKIQNAKRDPVQKEAKIKSYQLIKRPDP